MPINQDFNLVSTTLPTNKGGDYLQIHNSHTHGTLTNPHGHKPQVNINPNTGVGNTIRKDFEVFSDTINRADKELRDGTMRIRTGRKDLGGIKN